MHRAACKMPLLSFLSKKRQSRPSGRGGQENVPSAAVARTRDNDRRSSYAAADLTKPPQPQHHRQQSQQHRRASIAATAVAAQRATPSPPAELLSDGPGAISCDAGSSGGDERQALAAPTVATGPRDHAQAQDTGTEQEERRSSRRYSVRRDPFRLFRSRSSQFRADGIAIGADVASEGHQHRARVSWPVQRRSTSSTPASEVQQGEVQTQTRTSAPSPVPVPVAAARNVREEATADERREPEGLPVDQRIGATGKAWPGRALELDAPPAAAAVAAAAQAQRQARRRSTADVSSAANSNPPASSSNALQRLRRLPSLSLKRGFSRRKKVEMPSVMVTPATVVSCTPSRFCSFFFLLWLESLEEQVLSSLDFLFFFFSCLFVSAPSRRLPHCKEHFEKKHLSTWFCSTPPSRPSLRLASMLLSFSGWRVVLDP